MCPGSQLSQLSTPKPHSSSSARMETRHPAPLPKRLLGAEGGGVAYSMAGVPRNCSVAARGRGFCRKGIHFCFR